MKSEHDGDAAASEFVQLNSERAGDAAASGQLHPGQSRLNESRIRESGQPVKPEAGRPDSMLREVRVEDAVGMVLAHDLTQIIPGQFKGRLFKKGHVIRAEDIPQLLNIGKEHIYTMQLQAGFLHEDEAAMRIAAAAAGAGLVLTEPHEGKVNLRAAGHGLLKVDRTFVDAVNALDQVVLSTLRDNTVVQPQQNVAGARVVPLIVREDPILRLEELAARKQARSGQFGTGQVSNKQAGSGQTAAWGEDAGQGPGKAATGRDGSAAAAICVKPFRTLRVGLITTGSEVFKGRIQDKFGPVVKEKVAALGSAVIEQRFAPDDSETIVQEIRYFCDLGVDLLLLTGGMSVDPDDRTPGAIARAGARVVSYGTPMLPGSMLMMAYLGDIPVLGLPGCVMHDPFTSFDVLLPRICAGEEITKPFITSLGYGGFYSC